MPILVLVFRLIFVQLFRYHMSICYTNLAADFSYFEIWSFHLMWPFQAILLFVQTDFAYLFWLYLTHIWQLIYYVLTFYRFHSSELTFLFVTQTPHKLICSWGVNLWILFPLRLRNLLKCRQLCTLVINTLNSPNSIFSY